MPFSEVLQALSRFHSPCTYKLRKMKINIRTRLLTMLLIVSFLLIIQAIRNSFKIDEFLRKLRIQNGVKATRRRAELSVDPNDSNIQSSPNKDGNVILNDNLKAVTIGNFKTDIKNVHPSKKIPQTTKNREHKTKGILKRVTTGSPKTDTGKVHPSKQVPKTTKAQDTIGILKRVSTGNFKTDNLKVHPTTQVPQTTASQEHKTKHLNIYPKNDGTYLGYGETNCRRARDKNVFAKLFEHWVNLAKIEKIEYFLSCGTLLGSLRNGDIIPHDTDIDVLIKRSDFLKIKKNSTTKPFSPYGKEIHVYVNKDFDKPFNKRRRFKCSGQVFICFSFVVLP